MAVSISRFDQFIEFFGDNGIDMDNDEFKLALFGSAYVFNKANTSYLDQNQHALSTNNGYVGNGQALTSVTWVTSGNTVTFDAADVTWTASGGNIGPADDAVLYSETSTVPKADLVAYSIFFDGSQTAGDGTDFKVTWNASGIFTAQ